MQPLISQRSPLWRQLEKLRVGIGLLSKYLERELISIVKALLDEALITADLDTFVQQLTATLSGDTTHSNSESE